MQQTYIVDSANAPWKRGSTEGITFACQVLLAGEDGGPEALRFRFDDSPSVYGHMHLTSQFQLLLERRHGLPARGQASRRRSPFITPITTCPTGRSQCPAGTTCSYCTRKPAASSRCRISMRGARFISAGAFLPHWRPIRPGSPCPECLTDRFKLLDAARDYGPAAVDRQGAGPRLARHAGGRIRAL